MYLVWAHHYSFLWVYFWRWTHIFDMFWSDWYKFKVGEVCFYYHSFIYTYGECEWMKQKLGSFYSTSSSHCSEYTTFIERSSWHMHPHTHWHVWLITKAFFFKFYPLKATCWFMAVWFTVHSWVSPFHLTVFHVTHPLAVFYLSITGSLS